MKHTTQERNLRTQARHGQILARGPRPALILALGLLAVSLSGCIDADARGPPSDHPSHPAPLCTDHCRVVVEGDDTRSHESSVARNPLKPNHILVGALAWIGGEATDHCISTGLPPGTDMPDEACLDVGPGELWRHVSFDGGETWDSARFPGDVPPDHPLAIPGVMADPSVAFLSDGTAVYSGMYGKGGKSFEIFLARSHDGGMTWPEATIIAGAPSTFIGTPPTPAGPLSSVMDQPFLAVGPDDTLLATWAWYYDDGMQRQDLVTAVSHDGGVTWSEPVHITDDCKCRNARPVIAQDGTMFMMYLDRGDSRWVGPVYEAPIHMTRSDDGGATWTTWPVPDAHGSIGGDLAIHDGTLSIARADMDDEGRQTVHLMRSQDGGTTWADMVLGASEGEGQAIPMLDVAPDGHVFVIHYETGADERPWVVATRLAPDGRVVSQVLTDGPLGVHEYRGGIEWSIFGDYSGMFADEHGAIATWVGGDPDNADLIASFLDLPTWKGGEGPPGLGNQPDRGVSGP